MPQPMWVPAVGTILPPEACFGFIMGVLHSPAVVCRDEEGAWFHASDNISFLISFFSDCSQCFFPRNKHPLQPPPSDGKCIATSPALTWGTAPAGRCFGLVLMPSSVLHSSQECWQGGLPRHCQSCLPRKVFLEIDRGWCSEWDSRSGSILKTMQRDWGCFSERK